MVRIREIIEATALDKAILKFRGCKLTLTEDFTQLKSHLKVYSILGGLPDPADYELSLLEIYDNINFTINEIANFQNKNYDAELETIAQSYFNLRDEVNYAIKQIKLGLFDWINKN